MSEIEVIPAGQLTLFELADIANREHALVLAAGRGMLEHGIQAGEALKAAKQQLRHGQWLPWIDDNFDASARTAQVYMQVANAQRSAHLDESSLIKVLEKITGNPRQYVEDDARTIRPAQTGMNVAGERWTMYAGRLEDVLPGFQAASVDMIVTDPPYPAEDLPQWSTLGEQALHVLVDDGLLCALSGQYFLPETLERLGASGLRFGWTYCQPLPGSNARVQSRHLAQAWKPWLVFTKSAWPSGRIDWHPDVLDGVPIAKTRYRWEQTTGPAAQLIHFLSPNNGLVLDPFAGTGSYGVAALEMGRRFVGVEADADRFEQACERLREAER